MIVGHLQNLTFLGRQSNVMREKLDKSISKHHFSLTLLLLITKSNLSTFSSIKSFIVCIGSSRRISKYIHKAILLLLGRGSKEEWKEINYAFITSTENAFLQFTAPSIIMHSLHKYLFVGVLIINKRKPKVQVPRFLWFSQSANKQHRIDFYFHFFWLKTLSKTYFFSLATSPRVGVKSRMKITKKSVGRANEKRRFCCVFNDALTIELNFNGKPSLCVDFWFPIS